MKRYQTITLYRPDGLGTQWLDVSDLIVQYEGKRVTFISAGGDTTSILVGGGTVIIQESDTGPEPPRGPRL